MTPGLDLRGLAAGTRLTPAQRRVLVALVRHADEVPYLSASGLALRAGVSQPSVTRLAHVLGFDGYGALRDELRAVAVGDRRASESGDATRDVVDQEIDNLGRLRDGLAREVDWAGIGEAMVASEPLVVAGLRASRYLASYFSYLAAKVHPHVLDLGAAGTDPTDGVTAAHERGADVAVVVCMPRYPSATVALLGRLGRLGYRVVLVTDDLMPSPPVAPPGWRLAVPVGSGLTFDGHPTAVVVLALLVEALCNAAPGVTERRLESLDATAEDAATYWTP